MVMKLSNNVEKKVCFKVKTTAPKRYCVKPTTGVIGPKEAVTILVTLQPFDPNDPNEKGKHKFQVLSVLAPEGEFNIETLVSLFPIGLCVNGFVCNKKSFLFILTNVSGKKVL